MPHADRLRTITAMDLGSSSAIEAGSPGERAGWAMTAMDTLLALGLTVAVWLQLAMPRLAISGEPPRELGGRMPMSFGGPHFRGFAHFAPTPWTYLLVAACFLPLILRRRFPLGVLATVTVAAALYRLLPFPPTLVTLAPLVAIYTVGTRYPRGPLALATAATAGVTLAVSLPPFGASFWIAELVRVTALLAAAALWGDATRNRRAYVAEVERRAREAERTREEETRRRVDEERLRIARDLHDITAHSLSVIAVQSGVAEHVIDGDPEQARKALGAIRETSRQALNELRSVIGVLRGSGEAEGVPMAPPPRLGSLEGLAKPLEQAGFTVNVEVDGDVGALPALVDASAYRIVQEALTNALRHAGTSRVDVKIQVARESVRIDVTDDGRGAPTGAGPLEQRGHGITGMRERALALDGELEAGPRPGGGFRVSARLPLGGSRTGEVTVGGAES
jgi:signal transduction histidine kinase